MSRFPHSCALLFRVLSCLIVFSGPVSAGPAVVLDPGHGGTNKGAYGPEAELYEKHLTLAVARRVRRELTQRLPAIEVVLTRDADRHVPLRRRIRLVQEVGAKIFVSIHFNASQRRNRRGYESYVLKPDLLYRERLRLARQRLAENNNGTESAPLDDTQLIALDLDYRRLRFQSRRLAGGIQLQLQRLFGSETNRGVRESESDILKGLTVPAVLVEVGFIDHPEEGPMVAAQATQEQIAHALADAILKFLATEDETIAVN